MTAGSNDGLLPVVGALPGDAIALHIGVHKTGTTALQAALADARPELLEAGVLYPGRRPAHHGAALAMIGKSWGWRGRGGEVPDQRAFNRLAEKAGQASGRVMISSEHFCEADQATAATVVERLGIDRVQVVVTLRNLAHLLPSSWQQYLKYGVRAGYEDWLANTFEPPSERTISPSFWKRNDHGALIERWASCVGADRVTVIVLESVDRSAMFRTFAQLLGVDESLLVDRMNLTSNRSMTAQEAELLRLLNVRVRNELPWPEYERLVRNSAARGMVEGRTPGADEPRVHTPDWALDAAAERGADAARRIRASGVRVIGDLDLFAARIPSGAAPAERSLEVVPVAVAASALADVVLAAEREVSTRQMAADLARRVRSQVRARLRPRRAAS